MLFDVVMKLLPKLIKDCAITNLKLQEPQYSYHDESEQPELDILIIEERLSHFQLQEIDRILTEFANISMRIILGNGLLIYEQPELKKEASP